MQYHLATAAEDVWQVYWFEKNLLGDIVAVYNEAGTKLVSYKYDAWGNFTTIYFNSGYSTKAKDNPFTYRGYYYDKDLELYYLGSRYYDSVVKRFINADSALYHSMYGYNLYTYCYNNPVNYYDPYGESPETLILTGFGFAAADGPIPVGDIVGGVLIIIAGIQIISEFFDDDIPKTDYSNDIVADSPKSISPPIIDEEKEYIRHTKELAEKESYDPNPYGRPGEKSKIGKIEPRLENQKIGNRVIIREAESRPNQNRILLQKKGIENILILQKI